LRNLFIWYYEKHNDFIIIFLRILLFAHVFIMFVYVMCCIVFLVYGTGSRTDRADICIFTSCIHVKDKRANQETSISKMKFSVLKRFPGKVPILSSHLFNIENFFFFANFCISICMENNFLSVWAWMRIWSYW